MAHLWVVSSLKLPLSKSSSSLPSRLGMREAARELGAELPRELPLDDCLDWAFLEVVLPLSRALRRRSSCMLSVLEIWDKVGVPRGYLKVCRLQGLHGLVSMVWIQM